MTLTLANLEHNFTSHLKYFHAAGFNDFSATHQSRARVREKRRKPYVTAQTLRGDRCHGLRGSVSFREKEKIMSAFTFTLKTHQTALIPIKSMVFTGVAIIKSDLPIIFLIFLLILSPQCVWSALRAPEDRQGIDNGSLSSNPKT